ncbi:hypothetical protein GMRT_10529 [Giardia muris]|uniref:Uncharacterized protein n=1 Tax=Giardia muris TaxID=5742 RepID=A0A4Z1T3B1_GIAMU|nr:hypothetical protein GMRT_10529 [Giardia muris]|eukprot:TNJ26891.1 hypothetical protein GMRT_10529 [Giardia muris]
MQGSIFGKPAGGIFGGGAFGQPQQPLAFGATSADTASKSMRAFGISAPTDASRPTQPAQQLPGFGMQLAKPKAPESVVQGVLGRFQPAHLAKYVQLAYSDMAAFSAFRAGLPPPTAPLASNTSLTPAPTSGPTQTLGAPFPSFGKPSMGLFKTQPPQTDGNTVDVKGLLGRAEAQQQQIWKLRDAVIGASTPLRQRLAEMMSTAQLLDAQRQQCQAMRANIGFKLLRLLESRGSGDQYGKQVQELGRVCTTEIGLAEQALRSARSERSPLGMFSALWRTLDRQTAGDIRALVLQELAFLQRLVDRANVLLGVGDPTQLDHLTVKELV